MRQLSSLLWIVVALIVSLGIFLGLLEPHFTPSTRDAEATNEPNTNSYYKISLNHVYWLDPSGEPVGTVDLTDEYGTDAATFHVINPDQRWVGSHTGVYGYDKFRVYFQYEDIPGADPRTFSIVDAESALSKDKGHVYIRTEYYSQLDPASLRFLDRSDRFFYIFSNGQTFSFDQAMNRLINTTKGSQP
jgi:DKNYY family